MLEMHFDILISQPINYLGSNLDSKADLIGRAVNLVNVTYANICDICEHMWTYVTYVTYVNICDLCEHMWHIWTYVSYVNICDLCEHMWHMWTYVTYVTYLIGGAVNLVNVRWRLLFRPVQHGLSVENILLYRDATE